MKKIAINGFGRIGRLTFRNILNKSSLDVIAINDLTDTATLAHLLKYDSAHGVFPGSVDYTPNSLIVNGKEIIITAVRNPSELPWGKLGIDMVIESTGLFTSKEQLEMHITAGAKKVGLSAPAKENVKTIVLGVNDHLLTNTDKSFSNASCTTNCLAPMMKVLNDNFGVKKGYMLTVHAYTNDQNLVDNFHKKYRRGRSAALNMVITETGAGKAVTKALPSFEGKLTSNAIRVPVPNGSLAILNLNLSCKTSVVGINTVMKKYALEGDLVEQIKYEINDPKNDNSRVI